MRACVLPGVKVPRIAPALLIACREHTAPQPLQRAECGGLRVRLCRCPHACEWDQHASAVWPLASAGED